MPDVEQIADARPAATVLIARDAGSEIEILLGQRSPNMRFMAGAHVFPGGAVQASDGSPLLAARVRVAALPWPDANDAELDRLHALAAVRETLEEVGLLLGCDAIEPAALRHLRSTLREGTDFAESLTMAGLDLDLSALVPLIRWITPRQEPIRFDTRFYVARAPSAQPAEVDARETVAISWLSPSAAIEAARAGRVRLSPPTQRTLHQISSFTSIAALFAFAQAGNAPTIEPVIRELDGKRVILFPGDPEHPVAKRALRGPTRAVF